MKSIFHLYETLTKMRIYPSLNDKMVPLDKPDDLNYLDGKFKNVSDFPDVLLSNTRCGWTKYNYYFFKELLNIHHKSYMVRNLLHIIHPSNDDIIIARVIKLDKKKNEYVIRYIVFKKNKEQTCSSLKEVNSCLSSSFEYDGRPLNKDDFSEVK